MYKISKIAFLLFLLFHNYTIAQDTLLAGKKDAADYLYKIFPKYKKKADGPKITKKVSLALIPTTQTNIGTFGIVTPLVIVFRLDTARKTKLSLVYVTPYFTLSDQFVFTVRNYVFLKDNKYNLTGDWRYMIYPQLSYGLGPTNSEEEQVTVYYQTFRFHQFITKKTIRNNYFGGGFELDKYFDISEKELKTDTSDFSRYQKQDYSDHYSNAITPQFLHDSRDNPLNAYKGNFLRIDYRMNRQIVGSTNNWDHLIIDAKKYFSFNNQRKSVLAFWSYYWTITAGTPHYLDLPSIGWDFLGRSGRGIKRNTLRSNALLYFESEYRFDLVKSGLWGAVVFGNLTSPSELGTQKFVTLYPAGGVGLRLKYDKKINNNLSLDVGFSKNYWGLYVGISEYF